MPPVFRASRFWTINSGREIFAPPPSNPTFRDKTVHQIVVTTPKSEAVTMPPATRREWRALRGKQISRTIV
jgi:hypothetical protein